LAVTGVPNQVVAGTYLIALNIGAYLHNAVHGGNVPDAHPELRVHPAVIGILVGPCH
jgi:hypothetical protein